MVNSPLHGLEKLYLLPLKMTLNINENIRMNRNLFPLALILIFLIGPFSILKVSAWSEHPLLVRPALKNHPVWQKADSVQAKNLKTFLLETEKELEKFLADHEAWSVANLPNYAPCPAGLAFKATGNPDDILLRFYTAIRINPHVKIPLYLHLLPNDSTEGRPVADPKEICTLEDLSFMLNTVYTRVEEGEILAPFDVLVTANDEPDYGFDLGLFVDNMTPYGQEYGFGAQSFGNPQLEYGSQAPFHMGFYHEAKILYKFGPFLKQTYMDYRLFLYKALSEFAFRQQQPYWGWRFMGWGMHYMGDVSMPYHMRPLPGVSTARMMWINLKAMLGFPKAKEQAVQLVSNRHTAFEEFQLQVIRKAHQDKNFSHPFLQALENPLPTVSFSMGFFLNVATKESAASGEEIDKILERQMPALLVSDPNVETNDLPETDRIVAYMTETNGPESVEKVTEAIAGRMRQFSMNIRSFLDDIVVHTVLP